MVVKYYNMTLHFMSIYISTCTIWALEAPSLQFPFYHENKARSVIHRHWWLVYHKMCTSVGELPHCHLLTCCRLWGLWERRSAMMKWWIRAGEMREGGELRKKQLWEIRRVKIITKRQRKSLTVLARRITLSVTPIHILYEYKQTGRGVFVCFLWDDSQINSWI